MRQPKFANPWPHASHGILDILAWKTGMRAREQPALADAWNAPAGWQPLGPEAMRLPPASGWRIAWLGHASFLVQGCGLNLLIDPVFADYCSPVPLRPLRRKVPPPCALSDLPVIHAVLLTHSHYDHLDLSTLKALGGKPRIFIAEGHATWLSRKLGRPVEELPWHESLPLNGELRVTATPAQHFTARTPFDRNRGHWCGWLLDGGGCKLWHAGDSGYCPAFREIGERHGPVDFGMIPIGAYQPRQIMQPIHMNPEEAVQAFLDARCQRAAAMHWGTFALTDEPMQEPSLRLRHEIQRRQMLPEVFTAGNVGSIWTVTPRQQST
jgi:N-acyl-phosphatidylethanolamine-hydrolysing phospholipase D